MMNYALKDFFFAPSYCICGTTYNTLIILYFQLLDGAQLIYDLLSHCFPTIET